MAFIGTTDGDGLLTMRNHAEVNQLASKAGVPQGADGMIDSFVDAEASKFV